MVESRFLLTLIQDLSCFGDKCFCVFLSFVSVEINPGFLTSPVLLLAVILALF